ncbi:phage virion morphogenesis protein [Francisella marina]|uniref:Uncharacterized protein n=1 Tax=Francisella marina TaxID=2249302 RepID=A0ABX5ZH82_9GAMM|nr:hypothetical protein [Francisella marina]QEO57565.1 hypothetical protein F0R74_06755 [Francisella marina]
MSNKDNKQLEKELRQLTKKFKKLSNKNVYVGVNKEKLSKEAYGNGVSVLEVAHFHEFGHGNNPRRSFLYDTFEVKKQELMKGVKVELKEFLDNEKANANNTLSRVGERAKDLVLEAFETEGFGKWQEHSETTVKNKVAKGSTDPKILQDTGTLKQNISYVIKKR